MNNKNDVRKDFKSQNSKGANFFAVIDCDMTLKNLPTTLTELCESCLLLEQKGEYLKASELLKDYWDGIGHIVETENLTSIEAAHLLLRVGSVAGFIADTNQIPTGQEMARKYLSQAEDLFTKLDDSDNKAMCLLKMGICHWRAGENNKAENCFDKARQFTVSDETKATVFCYAATVKATAYKYFEALEDYKKAYEFIGGISDWTEGSIRNGIALAYKNIGKSKKTSSEQEEYFDKAIIEFEGALLCYENIGNKSFAIIARNNIAFTNYSLGRYEEALESLQGVQLQAYRLRDSSLVSMISDTICRVHLALNDYKEAISSAKLAVNFLKKRESSNRLSEAYRNLGVAFARNGQIAEARAAFEEAASVAYHVDDLALEAYAKLLELQELFLTFNAFERKERFCEAVKVLAGNQEKEIIDALKLLAENMLILSEHNAEPKKEVEVIRLLAPPSVESRKRTLTLPVNIEEELINFERPYFEEAIRQTRGNQVQAAELLGLSRPTFKNHIDRRFPELNDQLQTLDKKSQNFHLFPTHELFLPPELAHSKIMQSLLTGDFLSCKKGDVLLIEIGKFEIDKIVALNANNALKIGILRKSDDVFFLETEDRRSLPLNQQGMSQIVGTVFGYCPAADYRNYTAKLKTKRKKRFSEPLPIKFF